MKLLLLVCVLVQAQDIAPGDLENGKKLYESHCALCHGETGTGGKGPPLARPVIERAPDDKRLVEIITEGIPGTEMPGAWQITGHEAAGIASYVRSLGRIAPERLPGNADRGRAVYEKSGCVSCHIVRGEGSSLGPELTEIGARRSSAYLREALLQPGASAPEGFLMVTATARDGSAVRGMRVNEDTFTIQIRDGAGRFHSFRKSGLKSLARDPRASLMPSYESRLSAGELDDLIAYLASLRGEK